MNKAPKNEHDLERCLRGIEKLRNASDFTNAVDACTRLVDEEATRAAGLRARADIYADMRQAGSELSDREALAALETGEPSDHFDLGVSLWRAGRIAEAAFSFARAIEIGVQEDFHSYTNASRMHLAALLIKLNRREEALQECLLVPQAYSSYLPDGMTTREQLLDRLR